MDVTSAVTLRIRAQAESDSFTSACGSQESDIKEEIDGVVALFKNVLSSGRADAVALRDGGYLYMKANTSTRAVNETRIRNAVENITLAQLRRIAAEVTSITELLCACLEENLEDECLTVSYTPHVAKRRPAQLSETARCTAATRAIEEAVARYRQLKLSLGVLRKHKSGGRKRVAEVNKQTEPVLLAHMQEHAAKRQQVEWCARRRRTSRRPLLRRPRPASTLPVILPEHADEPPCGRAAAARPMTLVILNCEPKAYQIKRSTYTSAARPPACAPSPKVCRIASPGSRRARRSPRPR